MKWFLTKMYSSFFEILNLSEVKIFNNDFSSFTNVLDGMNSDDWFVSFFEVFDLLFQTDFHEMIKTFVVCSTWRSSWKALFLF